MKRQGKIARGDGYNEIHLLLVSISKSTPSKFATISLPNLATNLGWISTLLVIRGGGGKTYGICMLPSKLKLPSSSP